MPLGFLLSLALRFPKASAFFLKHRKTLLAGGAAIIIGGAALFAFVSWRNDLIKDSRAEGRAAAEQAFAAERAKLDAQIKSDNEALAQMSVSLGKLADGRVTQIIRTTAPTIERVTREVYTDPRYSDCTVSDGVLNDLNQARDAVDRTVAASAPGRTR